MEPYRRVLVPLDGSELAESVFPQVRAISSACRPGGIIFARVVEPILWPVSPGIDISPDVAQDVEREQLAAAQEYLHRVKDFFSREGVESTTKVLMGYPADALSAFAEESKVDLIILATHGRTGLGRWVWGSVADRILRSSSIPVMMVRAVAHTDGSKKPLGAASTAR